MTPETSHHVLRETNDFVSPTEDPPIGSMTTVPRDTSSGHGSTDGTSIEVLSLSTHQANSLDLPIEVFPVPGLELTVSGTANATVSIDNDDTANSLSLSSDDAPIQIPDGSPHTVAIDVTGESITDELLGGSTSTCASVIEDSTSVDPFATMTNPLPSVEISTKPIDTPHVEDTSFLNTSAAYVGDVIGVSELAGHRMPICVETNPFEDGYTDLNIAALYAGPDFDHTFRILDPDYSARHERVDEKDRIAPESHLTAEETVENTLLDVPPEHPNEPPIDTEVLPIDTPDTISKETYPTPTIGTPRDQQILDEEFDKSEDDMSDTSSVESPSPDTVEVININVDGGIESLYDGGHTTTVSPVVHYPGMGTTESSFPTQAVGLGGDRVDNTSVICTIGLLVIFHAILRSLRRGSGRVTGPKICCCTSYLQTRAPTRLPASAFSRGISYDGLGAAVNALSMRVRGLQLSQDTLAEHLVDASTQVLESVRFMLETDMCRDPEFES
jgi:hypothetical protein